jgi:16S rRNA (uracil1498-N3)-methyltransferase
MHIPTIFDANYESSKEDYVLSEEKLHHLNNVLRVKDGSDVMVTNGEGIISHGKISNLKVDIFETITHQRNNELNIFIAKLQDKTRMRQLIEKLTELGVKSITIGPTKNSQKVNIDTKKLNTWIIGAIEQSGIPFIPKVNLENKLDFNKFQHTFDITGKSLKKNIEFSNFAIGPEGGWSKDELKNFRYISKLSDFTLRSDTAAIVAVSLMM